MGAKDYLCNAQSKDAMKPKLLLFILLWKLGYGMTGAQKRLVAIDADYHFPVAGTSVTTNGLNSEDDFEYDKNGGDQGYAW